MPFKQWFLLNIFTCMNINNICDLLLLFLQNVLSNMVHSLLFCNQGDLIGLSSRLEWLPLLHNVIMFHIGLSLRHHTMPSAFCQAYNWNHTHLMVFANKIIMFEIQWKFDFVGSKVTYLKCACDMRFWKTELCGIDFFGRSQNFSQMICKGLHCCICYPVVCKVWSHGLEAFEVLRFILFKEE